MIWHCKCESCGLMQPVPQLNPSKLPEGWELRVDRVDPAGDVALCVGCVRSQQVAQRWVHENLEKLDV